MGCCHSASLPKYTETADSRRRATSREVAKDDGGDMRLNHHLRAGALAKAVIHKKKKKQKQKKNFEKTNNGLASSDKDSAGSHCGEGSSVSRSKATFGGHHNASGVLASKQRVVNSLNPARKSALDRINSDLEKNPVQLRQKPKRKIPSPGSLKALQNASHSQPTSGQKREKRANEKVLAPSQSSETLSMAQQVRSKEQMSSHPTVEGHQGKKSKPNSKHPMSETSGAKQISRTSIVSDSNPSGASQPSSKRSAASLQSKAKTDPACLNLAGTDEVNTNYVNSASISVAGKASEEERKKEFFAKQRRAKKEKEDAKRREEKAKLASMDDEARAVYLKSQADAAEHERQQSKMLQKQMKAFAGSAVKKKGGKKNRKKGQGRGRGRGRGKSKGKGKGKGKGEQ